MNDKQQDNVILSADQIKALIPERKKDLDYDLVPEGTRLLGVVMIKSVEMKDFNDPTIMEPGFQVTLRDPALANGYVNIRFKAKMGERSNFYKFLNNVLDGDFPETAAREQYSNTLFKVLNTWVKGKVIHSISNDRTYANIKEFRVSPAGADAPKDDPLTFFKKLEESNKDNLVF